MSRFPTIRMPNLQLSEHDAADLLSYLEARSFADTAGKREAAIGTPRTDQHVDHGQRDQHRHH